MDYTGSYNRSDSAGVDENQASAKQGNMSEASSYTAKIQLPETVGHGTSHRAARESSEHVSRFAKSTTERSPTSFNEFSEVDGHEDFSDDEDHGLFVPDYGSTGYDYGLRHSVNASAHRMQAPRRSDQGRAQDVFNPSMHHEDARESQHGRGGRVYQGRVDGPAGRSSQPTQQAHGRQAPLSGGRPRHAHARNMAAGNNGRRFSTSIVSEAEQGLGSLAMRDDDYAEDDFESSDDEDDDDDAGMHSIVAPSGSRSQKSGMSAFGAGARPASSMRSGKGQIRDDMHSSRGSGTLSSLDVEHSSPLYGRDSRIKKKPHVNKAPTFLPMSTMSDTALAKRGVTRAYASQLSKRTAGANDPENVLIVDLKENKGMLWDDIAQLLNDERIKAGRKASFTANAVHNRYNRNAPVLFAAEGKEWVPISDRKLPIMIQTNWTPELDVQLIQAIQEVEAEKWSRVAARFSTLSGQQIGAKEAAYRNQAI